MQIEIGNRAIGDGQPCYIIAEAGVNHNGSMETAMRLIDAAKDAGADAVKFQKRTIEKCYTKAELDAPRESPWGNTTRQQKYALEFDFDAYSAINDYCRSIGMPWFASCWDTEAVDFIAQFDPPCFKIASASLTDKELLEHTAKQGKPILLSTGMSTLHEVELAQRVLYRIWWEEMNLNRLPLILMHCTSTYPSKPEELNLRCLITLNKYLGEILVGYSGHEVGLQTTLAAVMLGACVVERHLTLDRSMYGSDQASSVEPHGFAQMVRDIRVCEQARGDGIKRVYDSELPIKKKLRKVETLLNG